MAKKIGFIGLGIMGKPMALNLLKAGHTVTVFDIHTEAVLALKEVGANAAASAAEAAYESDIIITMLPKGEHVEAVVAGEQGILAAAKPGTIIIDMSSISPVTSRALAALAKQHQIEFIDAPVSGGEPKAIDGTLAIMAGGEEEIFEQVKDVLYAMGTDVVLVGSNGSGTTAKLANQIIVNLNIAAMSEALILAAKSGIAIDKMYEAIRGGLAGSAVLDAKVPLILERNFEPGGRIDINLKDLTNVMETAHDIGVPLPLSSQLLEIFHALKADGKSGLDHGGIVQYYEKMAHVEVKKG
ncbi:MULTISPECIES: 2-hydroxy-3-oxopropionate reductase [Bacillus]|uniref:2-hydroxy-3-oxopropionate reductase n=1 Tax=Bacillus TaxID=1386 RepID=UPI000E2ED23A|nr:MULTISPECIES: 2-hydroxy-3-oxopropionate reductase [Bacillus]MCA1018806.1 2-hydroxy-3-oxopropionate reductase [Bacillus stratosphericus]MCY7497400.1 2-hydroxy-3-oxopropionate reductase [Bacillus altitudinis]MCY7534007.1 2-hydroxy-3-oxopropionate reductase [Bacillus altitudinis]MCY7545970.1 2-hydroxy-3-oxopropionate reductase [Bacillus altitudinis]MCY7555407.1 2-hydroxy-3-oxopropionate reductase [Bacillus altitudinis]